MRHIRGALVALTLAVLVACGSEPNGVDATPTAAGDADTPSDDTRSLDELIAALDEVGCSLSEVDPTEGFDIFEQAACPDGSIVLYTFATQEARDEVVAGITDIEGEFAVVGGSWVAETKSRTDANNVKAELGGVVRS